MDTFSAKTRKGETKTASECKILGKLNHFEKYCVGTPPVNGYRYIGRAIIKV